MSKVIAPHCANCGRPFIPRNDEYCPHCHYPTSIAKEEAYLTTALASLQQAMSYGSAKLKIVDLFELYSSRLRALQNVKAATVLPTNVAERVTDRANSNGVKIASVVYQMHSPVQAKALAPPVSAKTLEPRRFFSWRSFFADQAITIVASLGAFLILVGALSFVATTADLLLAFLVVFAVHAVFGITGVVTRRFAVFRIVASIYTIIFALLVPLVGFSAYRLVGGNELALSVPALIAISATYAAIVYLMLALFQRYAPFAYPAMAALAVADLALASALNLAYWWWPSMLMILALISLVSVARSPRLNRVFDGNRAVLRKPVRLFMYVYVVLGSAGLVVVTLYSVLAYSLSQYHNAEVGYAILCLSMLRLVWSMGNFYLARRTRGLITLAFLFLVYVLAFCYALQFDVTGYALALTVVAILYAAISRFAVQLLHPFGALELQLDWIALALVLLVPFLTSPLVFLPVAQVFTSITAFQANWQTFAEIGALIAGTVLTLSIAFKRVRYEAASRQSAWQWLLLGGTFLFTCAYSLVILALHLSPLEFFLGATIAFMGGAVFARRYINDAWADPLDVSALYLMLITLGLSLNASRETSGWLLLFYFASTYAILLYQRRSNWFFVPTIFALLAIPALFNHMMVFVVVGIAFPLAAAGVRRFFMKQEVSPRTLYPFIQWPVNAWEWPLLVVGCVYAGTVGIIDMVSATSTIEQALSIPCPVGVELALFGLAWYVSAALSQVKGWLIPALVFATGALLLPTNSFWALVILTPALAILAVAARRFAGNAWSAPIAILALQAGIMTGVTGFTQQHLAATAIALLAFAIIAYMLGIIEKAVLLVWVTPFFATWSVIVSAGFLGDLFQPPVVALVAAALGIAVTLYRRKGNQRLTLSALPLYVTAFLAALLIAFWPQSTAQQSMVVAYSMLSFTAIALVILLIERLPELLVFPAGYAAGTIWLWYPRPDFTSLMVAYSVLCVLVYASQFVWRVWPNRQGWLAATTLHEVLGIGGQALVVAVILIQGGFSAGAGMLAQVGAGALCALAALVFFLGLLRPYTIAFSLPAHIDSEVRLQRIQIAIEVRHRCYYIAGLLLSLVVSWELLAFQETRLDVLLLAPASYLTVIAPFLMRDNAMRERRSLGKASAIAGACLLLLPALWFSFSDGNFVPTAILLGESLALLILGMIVRVRIFVLSSAGLVIVGTLRALFLATPPSLTLMITGVTLLVISTALILARHRLQIVWKQWD